MLSKFPKTVLVAGVRYRVRFTEDRIERDGRRYACDVKGKTLCVYKYLPWYELFVAIAHVTSYAWEIELKKAMTQGTATHPISNRVRAFMN